MPGSSNPYLIIKPRFDNGGGGIVAQERGTFIVRDRNGNVIETIEGNSAYGSEGIKTQIPSIRDGRAGSFEFNGTTYNVPNNAQRGEYNRGSSDPFRTGGRGSGIGSGGGSGGGGGGTSNTPRNPDGSPAGGPIIIGSGAAPGFTPFPNPTFANFNTIQQAPYQFTDVQEFAEKYGQFNREQIGQNFDLSRDQALKSLDTELQGLGKYIPQLTALKTAANSTLSNQFREQTKLNSDLRLNIIDELNDKRFQDVQEYGGLARTEQGRNEAQRRFDIEQLTGQRRSDIENFSGLRRQEIRNNEEQRRADIAANVQVQRGLLPGDNALNQEQRTNQLANVLPNEKGDFLAGRDELLSQRTNLLGQRGRAETYASGRAPDDVTNASLELNARSAAADQTSAGGFGAASSVARKSSDLFSANQRLQLAQYGEGLLGSNINASAANVGQINQNTAAQAALELAPTEYLNSAQQVRVEPGYSTDPGFSVDTKYGGDVGYSTAVGFNRDVAYSGDPGFSPQSGISQDAGFALTPSQSILGTVGQNLGAYNSGTLVSPGQALDSTVQQQQFDTNLQQRTREFNAEGEFRESTGNAGIANDFALGSFANDAAFQGGLANAAQNDINTRTALATSGNIADAIRDSGTAGAIGTGIGALAPILGPIIGGALSGGGGSIGGGSGSSITGGPGQAPSTLTIPETGVSYPSGESSGGPSGSVLVPSGEGIPSGFSGVQGGPDGGTYAVPTGSSPSYPITDSLPDFSFGTGQSGGGLNVGGGSELPGGGLTGGGDFGAAGDAGFSGGGGGGGDFGGGGGDFGGDLGARLSRSSGDGGDYTSAGQVLSTDPAVRSATFRLDGRAAPRSGVINTDVQRFSSDTGVAVPLDSGHPVTANLATGSNAVLNTAGIYNRGATGRRNIGLATDGSRVFGDERLLQNEDGTTGAQLTNGLGTLMSDMGALSDPDDIASWENVKNTSADQALKDKLTALYANQDKTGFIDAVQEKLGQPTVSQINKDPKSSKNADGLKTAFSAYQLYNNWDRMSPGQKSLGLAATGMQSYRYKSGEALGSKFVVKPKGPKDLSLTVGEGMQLAQQGYNVPAAVKNWDQLDRLQRVSGGAQSGAQVIKNAQKMGMVGVGNNGAAVRVSKEQIAKAGYTSAPHLGVGAITGGKAVDLPRDYKIVGRHKDGTVTAIPAGNETTAAVNPLRPSSTGGATLGALQKHSDWGETQRRGVAIGVAGGSGLLRGLQATNQENPYLSGGLYGANILATQLKPDSTVAAGVRTYNAGTAAYNLYNGQGASGVPYLNIASSAYTGYKILDSNMSNKDKARELRQTGENAVASYYTLGLSSFAQWADGKFLDGKIEKFRDKVSGSDAYWLINPAGKLGDFVTEKFLGYFGGGNPEHKQRDGLREGFQKAQFTDKDNNLTLADGSKVNLKIDGQEGMHAPANPALLSKEQQGKVDKMHSYDIDYTNDLDYASGMGGVTLSRILTGGKSLTVDQLGGQIGNSALGNVGYGKEFTEENYNKVMANQRAIYAQAGIKSKEDALQLANQAFNDGRIDETDLATSIQSFNMVFDDNSFETAQKLMSGRHAGVAAVSEENHRPTYRDTLINAPRPKDGNIDPGFTYPGAQLPGTPKAKDGSVPIQSSLPSEFAGLFGGQQLPDRLEGINGPIELRARGSARNARSLRDLGAALQAT